MAVSLSFMNLLIGEMNPIFKVLHEYSWEFFNAEGYPYLDVAERVCTHLEEMDW